VTANAGAVLAAGSPSMPIPAPERTPTPLGLTLAEFAAARGHRPPAQRTTYLHAMRNGVDVPLPPVTRCEEQGGLIKFCLPVGGEPDSGLLPEAARRGAGPPKVRRPQALETESVIIPMDSYRGVRWSTLCVSSQVGCRMGCTFCETGGMGLLRNLLPAEIVAQRLVARRLMHERFGRRPGPYRYFSDGIQNVVFMGMGEPLDNLDNVLQAIRVLNEPNGLAIPLSQITLSTVGRIDGLRRLAALARVEPLWRTLRIAVSLNAPTDALRATLMPVNRAMPLAELRQALCTYPLPPRGLFLIEYVVIKGVNDAPEHADQVAAWCRPLRCVVNLIPYNPQRAARYETPSDDTVQHFLRRLRAQGIFVKRRVTQGRDLMGACGQLGNSGHRSQDDTGGPPAPF